MIRLIVLILYITSHISGLERLIKSKDHYHSRYRTHCTIISLRADSSLSVSLVHISISPKSITLVQTYTSKVHNAHFFIQDFPLHSFSARKSASGITPNPNTR